MQILDVGDLECQSGEFVEMRSEEDRGASFGR